MIITMFVVRKAVRVGMIGVGNRHHYVRGKRVKRDGNEKMTRVSIKGHEEVVYVSLRWNISLIHTN